jgi:hypothetical protein
MQTGEFLDTAHSVAITRVRNAEQTKLLVDKPRMRAKSDRAFTQLPARVN